MFKSLLITAFVLFVSTNAQVAPQTANTTRANTTAPATNQTKPGNTSNSSAISNSSSPANTTNGTRPQNTSANTTTSSQNQTSNSSTPANTTNGTKPMVQNTTGNWSAPANTTNGTKPMVQNTTGNWSAPANSSNGTKPQNKTANTTAPGPKNVLPNDPKPFTPYDQLVEQFNKTIQGSLDLFADDYSRAEIENMIYNNNATGYREQTHHQNAEDLISALNDTGLNVKKSLGLTPHDVATTLNSSTILDDLKLGYDIGKVQANKTLAMSGIYDTTDQIVANQVIQNYTQDALSEIFAYLKNTGISPDVDNSVDMLKGQASKFTDSESTGDLLNKLLDTVATAASGPLYGVDQAIQQQSLPMGQKTSDIIGSFIEGMLNSGIARKGGRN